MPEKNALTLLILHNKLTSDRVTQWSESCLIAREVLMVGEFKSRHGYFSFFSMYIFFLFNLFIIVFPFGLFPFLLSADPLQLREILLITHF